MCILFAALQCHPEYPLVLVANRDEFYTRPSANAQFWLPERQLLAGQDRLQLGTWLGVDREGRVAALTNLRNGIKEKKQGRSRGDLVLRAITKPATVEDYLTHHAHQYNGFNLMFGDASGLKLFNSESRALLSLAPGYHAICNGPIEQKWPKMAQGERALEALLSTQATINIDALLALMTDTSIAPDEQLPATGVSLEWERKLASIFVQTEHYGTRCTSVLLVAKNGRMTFHERRYNQHGLVAGDSRFYWHNASELL
ncbi:NRDE family protein [Paraferrimonas haliotis]|uniref:NRDE family protein n=1 Tax=Paraferrimonas haliotis TaxID=2013866 RepID=A0AA37TPL7_9GAMM|nr:NRDE family protein [Paraferrimonas haliotis]GLS82077.1 hypothetical protein GCM10007894_00540 [Paraferrimonas haliotis]